MFDCRAGHYARLYVVAPGATAAEVTKMVLSGRVHVHGMHYIELQVRFLLRVANEGCSAGLCSAHALFRSPLPSLVPFCTQNFAAAYDFSSLKWLRFYQSQGDKYSAQLHSSLNAIGPDNLVGSADGAKVSAILCGNLAREQRAQACGSVSQLRSTRPLDTIRASTGYCH